MYAPEAPQPTMSPAAVDPAPTQPIDIMEILAAAKAQ
jgi:hypothetical protein